MKDLNVASHERFTYIQPRFSDFDLQGVLNSRQYMDLVGEARIEQMARHYQIPLQTYVARNQSWLLANFQISFKKPIVFPTNFFIETQVAKIEGSLVEVKFAFWGLDKEKLFSDGSVIYHLFDLKTRKLVSISEAEKDVFLRL